MHYFWHCRAISQYNCFKILEINGGWTALHLACHLGDLKAVEILLGVTDGWMQRLGMFHFIHFITLINLIQWTITNPVGTDWPAKRQKK